MMVTRTTRLAMVTAVLWFVFGVGGRARAALALPTPGGLSPGQSFRFAFVTDGFTNATSSNIANYNTFVNTQAEGATYNGEVIQWKAIASTSTVNAINNVGQSSAPVYLPDGTLVTTSTTSTGLWSGTLAHAINETLLGGPPPSGTGSWTGTNTHGEVSTIIGPNQIFAFPLGTLDFATFGNINSTDANWVDAGRTSEGGGIFGMHQYAISTPLTVQSAAIPEPSTLLMAGTAISAGFACSWFRRRRDQRRQRPVGQTDAIE